MDIAPDMTVGLSVIQIILCVALILGAYRTLTYGRGLALHGISTLSTYDELLHPYTGGNHLFLAAIPVLAAFVVLFLMRHEDTLLAVQAKERP